MYFEERQIKNRSENKKCNYNYSTVPNLINYYSVSQPFESLTKMQFLYEKFTLTKYFYQNMMFFVMENM